MQVPLLDLKPQYAALKDETLAAIEQVCASQHFILGKQVTQLEKDIAAYCRTGYGIGVSSGTDAILVGLMALGVGAGDEVITTPYTFVATATCIARLGARAVLVDIDPRSFNLDVARLKAAITSRTKAIVPVHLYGQAAGVSAIA